MFFIEFLPYFLGIIASLIVLGGPSTDIMVYQNSVASTFLSLSPLALLMAVSGLFLLSVFPGYIVYKIFLRKYGFSWFGKIGIWLIMSYCINGLLGLAIIYFQIFSLEVIVASIWILVLALEGLSKLRSSRDIESQLTLNSTPYESALLLSISLILLLGSYAIVWLSGPISGVTSGDISQYFVDISTYVHFGYTADGYVHLYSYLWMGHSLTGLPLTYVYSSLQYLILTVPMSIYLFMKILFSKNKKAAPIASLLVSVLLGLTSIPAIANLITSPQAYNSYMSGALSSTLSIFMKLGTANTGTYALTASTLDYALSILTIAFFFLYLSKSGSTRDLILGSLFLNVSLFTHFFFTFAIVIGTIVIFSVLSDISKKKLLFLMAVTLALFVPFNFFSHNSISNFFTLFLIIEPTFSPSGVRATGTRSFGLLLLAVISIYLLLLFRKELASKVNVPFHLSMPKVSISQVFTRSLLKYAFVVLGVSLLLFSIVFSNQNYTNIHVSSAWTNLSYVYPWYLPVMYWGLCIPIVFGTFLTSLKKNNKDSMKMVLSWLISVIVLAGFFYLFYIPGLPATLSSVVNRCLLYLFIPLTCLTTLGISMLFSNQSEESV